MKTFYKFVLGAQGLPDCCKRPFNLNIKQQQALRDQTTINCPFCKNPIGLIDEAERQRFTSFGNPCLYITIIPRIILVFIAVGLLIAAIKGYLKTFPSSIFYTIIGVGIVCAIGGNALAQYISNHKLRIRLQSIKK